MAKENQEYKDKLSEKYKERGFQSIPLSEYQALQAKKAKQAKALSVPVPVRFVLGTPFIIVFCFGLFFIPFTLFLVFSNPDFIITEAEKTSTSPSYDDLLLKDK